MSDIFISYAREDRLRAQELAAALQRHGWSVWWDRDIKAGQTFDRVIEDALESARCVLVLWSRESVESHWVRAEAAEGQERGALIPVRVDDVEPPLAFRQIQTADLLTWNGDPSDAEFERLVRDIGALLSQPSGSATTAPAGTSPATRAASMSAGSRRGVRRLAVVAALLVAIAGIVLAMMLVSRGPRPEPAESTSQTAKILPAVPGAVERRGGDVAVGGAGESKNSGRAQSGGTDQPGERPKGEPAGLGKVKLMGVLAAGEEPLNRALEWHLYEAQLNGLGERKHLQERYDVTFATELPAGRYFVTAAIDAARAEKEIEVIGGRVTEQQLLLNAGLAKLSGALTPDGPPVNRAVEWHIDQGKPNDVGDRAHVKERYGENFDCFLPEGAYWITATLDAAKTGKDIEVKAGAVTQERLVLDAGLVQVTAVLSRGGSPLGRAIEWHIYDAHADAVGDRKHVKESYAPALDYFLPVGRYLITAKFEQMKGQEEVEVTAGKSERVEVVLAP